MKFRIRHSLAYTYSRPVFLEPQQIRMRPRSDTTQRLLGFDLRVTPEPAGLAAGVDAENNPCHLVWFDGLSERFRVEAAYEVETLKANPFASFLLGGDLLPLRLSEAERTVLGPCLDAGALLEPGERELVEGLCRRLMDRGNHRIFGFLHELNRHLFDSVAKITRLDSGLQRVGETLGQARGACRDTALVFMAVCRAGAIPARFVSGCQEGDPDRPEGDLHGWAEVYLPGFGWIGYDPTHGLTVADRHVAYAASALPELAAPLSGTFRGTGAVSAMDHAIEIDRV